MGKGRGAGEEHGERGRERWEGTGGGDEREREGGSIEWEGKGMMGWEREGQDCEGSTLTCQHLQEKSSKAEDVHFGGLLGGVVGFRGSIAGATWTNGCQILLKVDCAIV